VREKPEALNNAMIAHVGVRSLQGYRALAKEFLRSTTPTAEGLAQAGYETWAENGELMVRYQGQWVAARVAALQGWI
jgi:hypothetical protein